MIPTLSSSAKETTESVTATLKSLYSNALQCSPDMNISLPSLKLPTECHAGRGGDAVTLDWRADDPAAGMSDLTLVVYDGSGGTPYFAHTLPLAFGGRRSGFVAEHLKQQQKKGGAAGGGGANPGATKEHKIEIYVPPLAARYMPAFLDYIYGSKLELSTESAPPLRYLSNRFDVRELHAAITKSFLPQDLDLSTAPKYCMAADQLKDYELRDKALRIMAERIERINASHLREMSPRLIRSLVQCESLQCGDGVLSEKVAQWLRSRDGIASNGEEVIVQIDNTNTDTHVANTNVVPLSDEDFYWITHIQQMPQISQHEALFYLNYAAKYPSVMAELGPGSLKHRCLVACSGSHAMENLVKHLQDPESTKIDLYANLQDSLKVQLLENAMVSAKNLREEKERLSLLREKADEDLLRSDEIMFDNLRREAASGKIVVLGCGIPTANGIYIDSSSGGAAAAAQLSPRSPGSPRSPRSKNDGGSTYEKEAVWNGSTVTFLLAPCRSGKFYAHYKLAVRQNNRTRVLYASPTSAGGSGAALPERGWEVEGEEEGIGPAPLFVGRIGGKE